MAAQSVACCNIPFTCFTSMPLSDANFWANGLTNTLPLGAELGAGCGADGKAAATGVAGGKPAACRYDNWEVNAKHMHIKK